VSHLLVARIAGMRRKGVVECLTIDVLCMGGRRPCTENGSSSFRSIGHGFRCLPSDGIAGNAQDADFIENPTGCIHRAIDIDAATRIVDYHNIERLPSCVLGGIADAEVEREPCHESAREARSRRYPASPV